MPTGASTVSVLASAEPVPHPIRPCRTDPIERVASPTLTGRALSEKSTKSAEAISARNCKKRVDTRGPAGSRFPPNDYRDDGGASCHIERARSWGSMSVDVVSRAAGEVVWKSDCHRTIFALTDIAGTNQTDSGVVQALSLSQGTSAFRPGGMIFRSILPARARFIRILQGPETYDSIISDVVGGGGANLPPAAGFHDPLISQIVLTIASEIDQGSFDQMLADVLSTALAVRMLRQCLDASAIMRVPLNGLSPQRWVRVRDYIETHLDDRLTLADLAAVACLSPYHFSRSFKQAVGVGPQRYIMRRRIERAKTLMRRTNRSLAWIAQEAGFTDQSHLTTMFRREMGLTPGRFRTALA